MYYGGIDAHKTFLTVVIVDQEGKQVRRRARVPAAEPERLLEALEGLRPLEVVVETCPFWPWIYDLLEPTEIGFHLAHASKLEVIARSDKKTDTLDAAVMARMLAAGLIPEVYPKPVEQRETCRLVRHRGLLVRDRTRNVNRIHNQLMQRGLQMPREQLLRAKGREWLTQTAWPRLSVEQQRTVETHLELIDTLTPKIQELDDLIEERSSQDARASLLRSIPGIGPYRSLLLVGEITPISRFRTARQLVRFAGLAPTVRQSGDRHARHGGIPRGANHAVRGALVSAIPSHLCAVPESSLSEYYTRQKERLGWRKARVATARKLAWAIHAMLRNGELWRG
jgi:transposase